METGTNWKDDSGLTQENVMNAGTRKTKLSTAIRNVDVALDMLDEQHVPDPAVFITDDGVNLVWQTMMNRLSMCFEGSSILMITTSVPEFSKPKSVEKEIHNPSEAATEIVEWIRTAQ